VEKDSRLSERTSARIALVESDDLIRALLETWLGEAGHRVRRVTLDDLKRGNGFDLLIANVPSPRGAVPLIRTLRAMHRVPIVLISARVSRGQGASVQLAAQFGVAAMLAKPFSRDELLNAVALALAS
jgi:DNA-binding response OmpR family regulator